MAALVQGTLKAAGESLNLKLETSTPLTPDEGEPLATYECIYCGIAKKKDANASNDNASAQEASHGGGVAEGGTTTGAATGGQPPAGPSPDIYLPPHVGRLSLFKNAVHFKADMFGLDLTELVLKRTHVRRVDGAQKYAARPPSPLCLSLPAQTCSALVAGCPRTH